MDELLRIDPEFESKIPPLTEEEYQLLEENILQDGVVLNPLIVWNGCIVDGHNRFRIIQAHPEIKYTVFEKEFPDRYAAIAWICCNQLGRRNLTPQRKKYLIGQRYEAEKLANCFRGNQYALADKSASGHFDPKQKSERTSECIAREINTSESYVRRAERYAKGVDAAEEIEPGIKQELLSGSIRPTDTAVAAIAKANLDDRPALVEQLRQSKQLPDKAPSPVQKQIPTEIEPSSITDDEAQPESEPKESELPTRPMTEIQKILAISSGMETAEELADESTMFYELEDAISTMIRRCLRCFESYPGLLSKKSYRRKVLKIFKKAIQFIHKIEQEEPT
ncbi:hypothetical protein LK436_01150 [Clostridium sp. M62/1]|uniref:hypothetical protein n=1 Tax=Clostridium sp. M62/1 TaxID=411486 RepID=UPI0001973494|nr:hypothetical protein [Clostridium sp. M62/1]EFE14275.1 hypothetical protein CLOM621_05102 [Clostridium sp. M62/1]UEB78957.1 hypothetical protein LK436_01150 [Clostridium sp. M62/1]